ncbi:MAG: aldolase catalytic domain-containing protein [Helicobacteraceae bacterium]|nr:aldolase catalytic domain-containing protein [Helicobacteraceae bacterium]
MKISILDCTLRDGGYINNWDFAPQHINRILTSLNAAKIDIIELGYLKDSATFGTLFQSINALESYASILKTAKKVAMINLGDFNIKSLEKNKNIIDGIRLAFHKKDLKIALESAAFIKNLGYKLFLQPMVSKSYSDIEFLQLVQSANKLKPHAFYIVDSFGSMGLKEFSHYLDMVENNLHSSIKIGYHSHNNMQLAFCNAIKMCESNLSHDILLDSSIYGIGRGAGNLNTELIADFLNKEYKKGYKTFYLLEIIDELLENLMRTKRWGFSPAQYLSAKLNCHPNYATYLLNQNNYHLTSSAKILEKIPLNKRINYDKALIDRLYKEFVLNVESQIKGDIDLSDKEIFLIASGASVAEFKDRILKQIKDSKNPCVISLNHDSKQIPANFCFFSNQKRFDAFCDSTSPHKLIITSNIKAKIPLNCVLDLSLYAFLDNELITSVINIILNVLKTKGIKAVKIAGLDGFSLDKPNYSYEENDCNIDLNAMQQSNKLTQKIINSFKTQMELEFITPSVFNADSG